MNKLPKNRDKTEEMVAGNPTLAAVNSDEFAADANSDATKSLPKIISFETLARCGEEIWIENGGQIYRLRRTRQGKLILTK